MKWQKILNLKFKFKPIGLIGVVIIVTFLILNSPKPEICTLVKPHNKKIAEITDKYHSEDITHYAHSAFKYVFSMNKKNFCFGNMDKSHDGYSYAVAHILQNKSFNIFKLWIMIWEILILLISIFLIKILIKYFKKNRKNFLQQQIMEI